MSWLFPLGIRRGAIGECAISVRTLLLSLARCLPLQYGDLDFGLQFIPHVSVYQPVARNQSHLRVVSYLLKVFYLGWCQSCLETAQRRQWRDFSTECHHARCARIEIPFALKETKWPFKSDPMHFKVLRTLLSGSKSEI